MASGHYFDADPAVASRPSSVELRLPDATVELRSDRGVFAAGRVDPGTMLLLREAPPPPAGGTLLDLGCGYGPIACTIARRAPGADVWALDVNTRARQLAQANAAALGLANVHVADPCEVDPGTRFDGMWSNPPIRIGKAGLHTLLDTWLVRLEPTASAWLVVQRHLGADSLAAWMAGRGWTVTRVTSKQGYRLLRVEARA